MKGRLASIFVAVFASIAALSVISCSGGAENGSKNTTVPPIEPVPLTKVTETGLAKVLDERLVGCWSNGRGEILRIGPNQMVYGFIRKSIKDSPKPVHFVNLESRADSTSLIRLEDRPQFFIFQEYVALKYDGTNQFNFEAISEEDFSTFEDYTNHMHVGYSGWVKGDCKPWYPNWYDKHYGFSG